MLRIRAAFIAILAAVTMSGTCAASEAEVASLLTDLNAWVESGHADAYYRSNDSGRLAWGEAYVLRSLMEAYNVTGDRRWLRMVARHAEVIFTNARDLPDTVACDPIYADGCRGWGTQTYSDQYDEYMVHDGHFCAPIAEYIATVFARDSLWGEFGEQARAHVLFLQRDVAAKWLRLWERRLPVEPEWGLTCRTWSGLKHIPHNQYAAFGTMLLFLDDVVRSPKYESQRLPRSEFDYRQYAVEMGEHFKRHLRIEPCDAYSWAYHAHEGYEDISHSNIEVEFAYELHRRELVFDDVDARRFGRTLTDILWNGDPNHPLLAKHLDGRLDWEWTTSAWSWTLLSAHDPLVGHVLRRVYAGQEPTSPSSYAARGRLARLCPEGDGRPEPIRLRNARVTLAMATFRPDTPSVVVQTDAVLPWAEITMPAPPPDMPIVLSVRRPDGALIAELPTPEHTGGTVRYAWNGRDRHNALVDSGACVCRLAWGESTLDTPFRWHMSEEQYMLSRALAAEPADSRRGVPPSFRLLGPFIDPPHVASEPLRPGDLLPWGNATWHTCQPAADGYVDLRRLLDVSEKTAYAVVTLENPIAQRVIIGFGVNDTGAIDINGRRVFERTREGGAIRDEHLIATDLPAGRCEIVIRCGDTGGAAWGFYFRILSTTGSEVEWMRWESP